MGHPVKTMTCRQLGGACEKEFHADTFEEIAEMSRIHGMEMFEKNDADHLLAMNAMKELMQSPEAMNKWLADKKREFNIL